MTQQARADGSNNALETVVKGGAFQFAGKLFSTGIAFAISLVVIRYLPRDQYGLVTLVYSFTSVLTFVALLGLKSGMPRYIATARVQGSGASLGQLVTLLLPLVLLLAAAFSGAISHYSVPIADRLHKPDFAPVLAQLIWLLPMLVAIKFFVAVFRGKANAKAKLFFEDIFYQSSRLLLLILFCLLGLQLAGVIWAYLLSALLAAVGFAIFAFRQIKGIGAGINLPATGQLLRFSLPLLLVELMVDMYKLVATLALGFWSTADQVALYNAPLRAASFINLPLVGMLFLYLPVASRLFAQGKLAEAGELYVSTSKWIFMLALPICLACALDGRFLLELLYGQAYVEAWPTLLVLAIGLGLHNFLGANGNAMVAQGYTFAPLQSTLLALLASLGCAYWLIPTLGALGAALGVALGQTLSNLYLSIMLYLKSGIHPLQRHFLLPVALTLLCALLLRGGIWLSGWDGLVIHLAFWLALLLLPVLLLLLTGSLTRADRDLLRLLERKLTGRTRLSQWLERHEG